MPLTRACLPMDICRFHISQVFKSWLTHGKNYKKSPKQFAWCFIAIFLILFLPGCITYQPRPLNPAKIIEEIENSYQSLTVVPHENSENSGVTFLQCSQWMLVHGPEIQEAIAEFNTALSRSEIKTPIPNPTLEVGPEYGFGPDVTQNRIVPFGALGITIPINGRLSKEDNLNRLRTEVARVSGVAKHRELYLNLRQLYLEFILAIKRTEFRQQLLLSAEQSVFTARRLVDAGQGTAIDVSLFILEKGNTEVQLLEAKISEANAKAALASLVGVHDSNFSQLPKKPLPELPQNSPSFQEAKLILLENHPALASLRSQYEESEAHLRLEIAKQFPDIRVGPSAAGESGEKKSTLGLTIGIDLPIFDRNQQSIAESKARREEIRTRYQSTAKRALLELKRSLRSLGSANERLSLLKKILLTAQSNIELAKKSLNAGTGDALRILDSQRSYRRILIEVNEAEVAVRRAWTQLEQAVGKPLFRFPYEDNSNTQPPEVLRKVSYDHPEEKKK